jgi:hypothetical protein
LSKSFRVDPDTLRGLIQIGGQMNPDDAGPQYAAGKFANGDNPFYYDGAIAVAFLIMELMEDLSFGELEEYLSAIAAQAALHRKNTLAESC